MFLPTYKNVYIWLFIVLKLSTSDDITYCSNVIHNDNQTNIKSINVSSDKNKIYIMNFKWLFWTYLQS